MSDLQWWLQKSSSFLTVICPTLNCCFCFRTRSLKSIVLHLLTYIERSRVESVAAIVPKPWAHCSQYKEDFWYNCQQVSLVAERSEPDSETAAS